MNTFTLENRTANTTIETSLTPCVILRNVIRYDHHRLGLSPIDYAGGMMLSGDPDTDYLTFVKARVLGDESNPYLIDHASSCFVLFELDSTSILGAVDLEAKKMKYYDVTEMITKEDDVLWDSIEISTLKEFMSAPQFKHAEENQWWS